MRRLLAVASLALVGCVSYSPLPPRKPEPKPVSVGWYSPIGRHHPLAGQIWRTRDARFVHRADLTRALVEAKLVVLGEQHDNADHHRLQAALLRDMALGGRRPAVLFEMIDVDEQPRIDAAAAAGLTRDSIPRAVGWEKKGWPAWAMYAPIADVAIEYRLRVVAANEPLRKVRAIAKSGLAALGAEETNELDLRDPMPEPLATSLRDELVASPCGHVHGAVERMVDAQRARDARMALGLLFAAKPDGAVLIAGAGHARSDRGVPFAIGYFSRMARVLSVGFVEVEEGRNAPAAYADAWHASSLPFDYVVFTPRVSDEDPCAHHRR